MAVTLSQLGVHLRVSADPDVAPTGGRRDSPGAGAGDKCYAKMVEDLRPPRPFRP